jgi:hypothetical protein
MCHIEEKTLASCGIGVAIFPTGRRLRFSSVTTSHQPGAGSQCVTSATAESAAVPVCILLS